MTIDSLLYYISPAIDIDLYCSLEASFRLQEPDLGPVAAYMIGVYRSMFRGAAVGAACGVALALGYEVDPFWPVFLAGLQGGVIDMAMFTAGLLITG